MTGHLPTWTRCSTLFVSLAAPAVFACGFDWPNGDGLAHATFDTHALCRADEGALVLDYSQAFATGEGLWAPDLSKLPDDAGVVDKLAHRFGPAAVEAIGKVEAFGARVKSRLRSR